MGIWDKVSDVAGDVVDGVKDVGGDVLDIGGNVVESVVDVGESVVDTVVDFGGDVVGGVKTVGSNVLDRAGSLLGGGMPGGPDLGGPFGVEPIGREGRRLGGMPASRGAVAPCSFQLDVQWIIDVIDKIKSVVSKVEHVASNILKYAHRVLDSLGGIIGAICSFPPLNFAKDLVKAMCHLAIKAVSAIAKIYNAVLEVTKHVLAPWEVRSAGEQIRDDLAPKCADFSQMLHPGNLKSASSWTGPSADAFRTTMTRQFDISQTVAEAAMEFGGKVQEIGADGVKTTVTFATKLVQTIVGIITAAISMAAIPVGTAVGAGAVLGLVGKVIAYVMVYVNAMLEIIQQSTALGNAASSVPGGQWPVATV